MQRLQRIIDWLEKRLGPSDWDPVRYRGLTFLLELMFRACPDPWNYRHSRRANLRYEKILEVLKTLDGCARIVEVGCAEGLFTRRLVREGYSVLGVDASPTAIRRARRQCPEASFRCARLEDLVVPERFDVVIAAEMIYYTRSPRSCVARLESLAERVMITYDYREHDRLQGAFQHIGAEYEEVFFNEEDPRRPANRIVLWRPDGAPPGRALGLDDVGRSRPFVADGVSATPRK